MNIETKTIELVEEDPSLVFKLIKEGQIVLRNDANKLRESTGKSINDVFKELFRYDR